MKRNTEARLTKINTNENFRCKFFISLFIFNIYFCVLEYSITSTRYDFVIRKPGSSCSCSDIHKFHQTIFSANSRSRAKVG